MPLIKTLRGTLARLVRWRPARKGEAGYEQRQYVLKHPKTEAEAADRVSRRTFLQKKEGKKLEALAAERHPTYSRTEQAKLTVANLRRRASFEKKKVYEGERATDISWFERFKQKRMARHTSKTTGEEVGGFHKQKHYARGKAFAERHPEVEKDFLKYVSSPVKKRDTRRRGNRGGNRTGTPKTNRDAQRIDKRARRRAA